VLHARHFKTFRFESLRSQAYSRFLCDICRLGQRHISTVLEDIQLKDTIKIDGYSGNSSQTPRSVSVSVIRRSRSQVSRVTKVVTRWLLTATVQKNDLQAVGIRSLLQHPDWWAPVLPDSPSFLTGFGPMSSNAVPPIHVPPNWIVRNRDSTGMH